MKKAVAILVVLIMIVGAVACFAGCDYKGVKAPVATSYVSIDINPSMTFVLNEYNKITSYICENEDALVWAYGENLVGTDIGQASKRLVDLAVKMGYLTEDNCTIAVSVTSDDEDVEDKVLGDIGSAVYEVDKTTNFDIKFDKEGSFLLNYQLAKLKEKNADNEYYQDLTAGRLRLINSAMAADLSLKMDDAVKMSAQELLAIVDKAHCDLDEFATKAFKEAKILADQTYQRAVVATQEATYIAKYMVYKGIVEGGLAISEYNALFIVSKTVELIAKGAELAQNLTNKALANEDVLAIATWLGVDVNALKDAEGNVTVDSVGAYVDKIAKNNADKMTQDMRDKLVIAIDKLEKSKDNLQDKPLSQEVVAQIKVLLESIEIKDIEWVDFSIQDLKDVAYKLADKANGVRAQMDASLTSEQKQEIVKAQKQAVDRLSVARNQYNQAIAKAEQDARKYFKNTKNARIEFLAQQAK